MARERFAAGRHLEDVGRWAEALEVFESVASVKLTPQVRFHLALCQENVGLWTRALDGYARAAKDATGVATDVVREANEHLQRLATTIPTVNLHVRGAAAGDELFLDGHRIAFSLDAEPLPMRADPGPHHAEVKRQGVVVADGSFALDPAATRWIELAVGAAPRAGESEGTSRGHGDRATPSLQRSLGWVSISVGAGAAVATAVFVGLRQDALSQIETACPSLKGCAPGLASTVDAGQRDTAMVNVLATVAVAAAVSGALLVLTATPHGPGHSPPVVLAVGPLSAALRGMF